MDLQGLFLHVALVDADRVDPEESSTRLCSDLVQRMPTVAVDLCFLAVDQYGVYGRWIAIVVRYGIVWRTVIYVMDF